MPEPIAVDLLYFDGCPNYDATLRDLDEAIDELRLDTQVRMVNITTQEEADRRHFAGSPTVQINGRDLEDYAGPGVMACRLYGGNAGQPDRELIRTRLRAAQRASTN